MTTCIKTSVNKNHEKNKIKQRTNSSITDLLKNEKTQQKPELRITNINENRLHSNDVWMERVQQVMDLTCRSEDEVIMAIHDCDEDLNRAVNSLLEGVSSEWEVKKKKARQSAISKPGAEQPHMVKNIDWSDISRLNSDRSSFSRGRVNHINRRWRRKENKENEKNSDEYNHGSISKNTKKEVRLRGGRGGGRLGSRSFCSREEFSKVPHSTNFNRPIETWTSSDVSQRSEELKKVTDCWNSAEANEDWENEEYTGSLADTKVFTPSSRVGEVNSTSQSKLSNLEPIESLKFSDFLSRNNQKQVKHRRRVPPPSKIPSSAVEMPDDSLNNSINLLDVQFGALEFGCESSLNDASCQGKYISCETHTDILTHEPNSSTTAMTTSINSLNPDSGQTLTGSKYNSVRNSNLILSEDSSILKEVRAQVGFTCGKISQSLDLKKTDLNLRTPVTSSSTFDSNFNYDSSKPIYASSNTSCSYNSYTREAQPSTTFSTTSTSNADSFPSMVSISQTGYKSSYSQSNVEPFDSTSTTPSTNVSETFIKTSSQGYSINSSISTTSVSQFSTSSTLTNVCYTSSPYTSTEYQQNPTSYNSPLPAYQLSSTSFSTSRSQPQVFLNNSQSVYDSTYSNYEVKNQTIPQSHKLNTSKNIQFENIPTTNTLVSTSATALDLTSNTINSTQPKTLVTNGSSKNTTSNSTLGSNNLNNLTGSSNSNIAPILGTQYIVGQSVPYATFQQPHMYSYEDLQMMQQRIPHMPSTGYYDATLGYQSTGTVTSLGTTRNDSLSNVQNVQSVQGQFNNLSDTRFTRADSNTSPVSSAISQQTSTQHSQPLLNPIPPGYAYFYGGSILPASGFQYGTPTMYPPIPPGSNSNSNSVSFPKPANYGSGYNSGANYDILATSGAASEYKSTSAGYTNNQLSKNNQSNGITSAGNSSDVNNVVYTKSHVTVSKINSYDKQSFLSGSTPPFGLTSNQTNVISGYGAPHLYIPTVPHQLHQPLHQETGNTSSQRTNSNSQNKTQAKSGYATSYWTGSN